MAFYADEDDAWKCADHPSRRRNIGVCPTCLRDRLAALCPECASLRPCNCCSTISASSSSSSSSLSLSFLSFPGDVGSIGRVSSLIDSEQSYRRSRSVALPFFKSARFSSAGEFADPPQKTRSSSLWMFLWPQRSKREVVVDDELELRTIRRSKSVAVEEARTGKSKGWYFPSPMKVFRHSKASNKIVQERSPLHRG